MKLSTATAIFLATASGSSAAPVLEERAAKCIPLNLSFQINVPHGAAPSITYDGLHWQFPSAVSKGTLVSFFGNFQGSDTTSSQITTVSESNPTEDGTSNSQAVATANGTTVVSTTFASGDASSAAGSAQDTTSSTSTTSQGNSNSTAIANAAGAVTIVTNATVAAASNAQSVDNERQAAAATSCAADNDGASASAEEITSVNFTSADGIKYHSVAYAACSAGFNAPSSSSGSSSSGGQASVSKVSASVTCDGTTTTVTDGLTQYIVMVEGSYCSGSGFSGAIAGQRAASSEAQC